MASRMIPLTWGVTLNVLNCAFRVLGCDIMLRSEDQVSYNFLRESYSAFLRETSSPSSEALLCHVSPSANGGGWSLQCGQTRTDCADVADLLYDFEKAMTLWIQKQRTELFFTHAAALSINNKCVVISGASGSGKSSLAWYLCQQGFGYLSDELAPIHPRHMHVEPYPHALCLKNQPLAGPPLPRSTIITSASMHVPAYELPSQALDQPCSICGILFIDAARDGRALKFGRISRAEAAARLYANGLNQLAHIGDGLPAAKHITETIPSVFLTGGTVDERSEVIKDLF